MCKLMSTTKIFSDGSLKNRNASLKLKPHNNINCQQISIEATLMGAKDRHKAMTKPFVLTKELQHAIGLCQINFCLIMLFN